MVSSADQNLFRASLCGVIPDQAHVSKEVFTVQKSNVDGRNYTNCAGACLQKTYSLGHVLFLADRTTFRFN